MNTTDNAATDNAATDYAVYIEGDLVAARRHVLPEDDSAATDMLAAAVAAKMGFDVTIRFSNRSVAFIAEEIFGSDYKTMTIEFGPVAFDGDEVE